MTEEKTARLFATAPSAIVVYELQPFDEPIIEPIYDERGHTTGIRHEVGRNKGETLHVRSEMAHIEGKLAYPLDGSDPVPYGPGKAGHWGRKARDMK